MNRTIDSSKKNAPRSSARTAAEKPAASRAMRDKGEALDEVFLEAFMPRVDSFLYPEPHMKYLLMSALLGTALLAGCSKPDDSAPSGKPASSAKQAADKPLPPPMPGATPFKMEAPKAPDPVALQKAIDEQRARDEKEGRKVEKAEKADPSTEAAAASAPAEAAPKKGSAKASK